MAIRRRLTGDADPPRRYYGFVDTVFDPDPDNARARLSIQLDAIDSNVFDVAPASLETDQGLALVRIQTTRGRLDSMDVGVPNEGDWLEVTIAKKAGNPRAWISPADGDFVPERVLNAPTIERLDGDPGLGPVQKLRALCTVPNAKRIEAQELVGKLDFTKRKNLTITALDVGQAACVAFSDGSRDFGYFDVGKPLSFNRRSFPKNFTRNYPDKGFVLLSHWDFDHFALAINNPSLMTLDWYAPDQNVGPYTARFQKALGSRLHFISGDATANGLLLKRCLGTQPRDRNATGYVFRFERNGETVLLTGDADYPWIPGDMKNKVTALMMPHHGGKGSQPPKPASGNVSIAVASYGNPNCYKHPDKDQLAAHKSQGWRLRHTASHDGMPRSDRQLFPLGQSIQRSHQIVIPVLETV